MNLASAKAQDVWRLFAEISKVPRCSKNEGAIVKWVCDFAKHNGWLCRVDSVGNVLIKVPASADRIECSSLTLQAHLDMVCEKEPSCPHDFSKDPISLIEKNGDLYADRTTLGADNGIGLALALALAKQDSLSHPPLELLFTVDEETGLTGAKALTKEFISSKRLINLDSEKEGVFTIGCAGGNQTEMFFDLDYASVPAGFVSYLLAVKQLRGGHSGVNIGLQRANAIKIAAGVLQVLLGQCEFALADFFGGNAHNAIARDCWVELWVKEQDVTKVQDLIKRQFDHYRQIYSVSDPEVTVAFEPHSARAKRVLTGDCAKRLINLFCVLPHGVWRWSDDFTDLVETSSNLALVRMTDKQCHLVTSQRSSKISGLNDVTQVVAGAAALSGARFVMSGFYPPWPPRQKSNLVDCCGAVYKETFGKEPHLEIIHAGLECGVIGDQFGDIDMVSLGPDISNPHSPQESVNIESVDKVWHFLLKLMPAL